MGSLVPVGRLPVAKDLSAADTKERFASEGVGLELAS